jgi:arginyl-tRNA synthetase
VNPLDELRAAVEQAATTLRGAEAPAGASLPALERPKQAGHGDYATNAAMMLAGALKAPPREIAERLSAALSGALGERLAGAEVAGPGFLNLTLADAWYREALVHVLAAGEDWGASEQAQPERILIEFVSANPTGPLHVGHSRNAAYGDALARLLEREGHAVEREYYVNDYGSQVRRLAESIQARARGEEPPEGGYVGDYIREVAAEIPDAANADLDELARIGVELMLDRIRASLEAFGVRMDHWFHERTLHEGEPSMSARAFERLAELGTSYEKDGALWLRTTQFGDDKDRVIERSTGEHTYFASDIAYQEEKRERGYDRLINVWGADHHGYVQRNKMAFQALGGDPDRLELLIMQFVHLVEGSGERAQMSKRSGDFVTLDELVEEIGVDAARWFLLQRSHDTTIDLDLELAREQSNDNPVYYVQYAHARIASVLAKAGEEKVTAALTASAQPAGPPTDAALEPAERELVKKLLEFPAEVAEAAEKRAPHRIAAYALELARSFTAFYRDCLIVGAEPEGLEQQRLALAVAAKRTIASALGLLGVSAPEQM